jgi:hypothetical protein
VLGVINSLYACHDATIEPSQMWHDNEEDREDDTNDHNDPNASR